MLINQTFKAKITLTNLGRFRAALTEKFEFEIACSGVQRYGHEDNLRRFRSVSGNFFTRQPAAMPTLSVYDL